MLRSIRGLYGWSIETEDGEIGHVADVYFDDSRWGVRYFVVNTSYWPVGRSVLISPQSVSGMDPARQALRTGLSRRQVALSPDIDLAKPVSRQHELELVHYYGFPSYAVTAGASVVLATPVLAANADADPHLRSVRAVTGYFVHAVDGDMGHSEDFLADNESWLIRYLLVSVGTWWPIRKVLVPVGWIASVSWGASAVEISLPAEAIRLAPEYDRASGVSREQEIRLDRYYGPPLFTST